MNPSTVARLEDRPPRAKRWKWKPDRIIRAYMREAKARSRAQTRLIDPDYDRSPRRDSVKANKRRERT